MLIMGFWVRMSVDRTLMWVRRCLFYRKLWQNLTGVDKKSNFLTFLSAAIYRWSLSEALDTIYSYTTYNYACTFTFGIFHWVKSVRVWRCSGPYSPHSDWIRTDTFYPVFSCCLLLNVIWQIWYHFFKIYP